MFPWQSGSDGREETQVVHLNPLNGEWGDDYSSLQRHVSLAIAYDVWEYYHTTGDLEFLKKYGAEMFLDICRFWAGKSELNPATGRYSIAKVMGPDEFHEQYHNSTEGGSARQCLHQHHGCMGHRQGFRSAESDWRTG
jgi:trehalose/maltose hydrolase-like predicted phosphorylase